MSFDLMVLAIDLTASDDDDSSPWMSMPLAVGIDHVGTSMSFGPRSDPAIDYILALAARHGLTIYDPQGDESRGRYSPISATE